METQWNQSVIVEWGWSYSVTVECEVGVTVESESKEWSMSGIRVSE